MENPALPAEPTASPVARVSQACVRCRKQKLKCDAIRPCTLCHRAGVRCEPRLTTLNRTSKPAHGRKTRKSQAFNIPAVSKQSPQHGRDDLRSRPQQAAELPNSPRERQQNSHVEHHALRSQNSSPAQPSQYPADVLRSPAAAADTSQVGSVTRRQQQRYGVNSSAVDFAAHIFNDSATPHTSDISSIPGHTGPSTHQSSSRVDGSQWSLATMRCPDYAVMQALIDVYFDRMHWFICIFHEPSLRTSAANVLSRHTWRRDELGAVLVCLTISAVGLQCIIHEPSWHGHRLLQENSLEPQLLLDSLVKEVKFHLWDLLEDCCIETVQVCSMIGTYYIFHSSPALSWSLLGLSVRMAYALALHCDDDADPEQDLIKAQVRRRNWNHIMVADTFAATIYGRPLSLDSAFSWVQPLQDLDDLAMGPTLSRHPLLTRQNHKNKTTITLSTFQVLKSRLYEIIREALNRFRLLRLQNPVSAANLESLVQSVQHIRGLLDVWTSELPPVFDCDSGRRGEILKELRSIPCPTRLEQKCRRHLCLQLQTLHLTYDSALIFIHRPLLEYRGSADLLRILPSHIPQVVADSLHLSVHAALRMSQVPIADFEGNFAISFILMNIFTAGVILCIPPTVWPFSPTAQDAKTGTMRIIRASRAIRRVNRIALHTEQLLTRLLKLSLQQEVDNGLQQDVNNNQPDLGFSIAGQEYQQLRQPIDCETSVSDKGQNENMNYARETEHELPKSRELRFEGTYSRHAQVIPGHTQLPGRDDQEANRIAASMEEPSASVIYTANDGNSSDSFLPSTLGYGDHLNQVDSQLDETFGTFGQILFNLVPNDPNSTWAWGNTNGF